jgi:hypothetical protein
LAPEARVLTSLEAILGQLYLAIVIATLVGIGVTSSAKLGAKSPQDREAP